MTWSRGPSVWLLITGIFELLLAAFFIVLGLIIPEVTFGFLLTGVILGLVGVGLLVWGMNARARYAEAQRIKQTGRQGQATITGLGQTGVWINNNPQVELNLLVDVDGARYPVTLREVVPQVLLGRLTSGSPLPVKVDRVNPSNVVIEWESAGALVGGFGAPPLPGVFPPAAGPAPGFPPSGGYSAPAFPPSGGYSAPRGDFPSSGPGYTPPGYPTSEYSPSGYPVPGAPAGTYPMPSYPEAGYGADPHATPGYPTAGYPAPGYPAPSHEPAAPSVPPPRSAGGSTSTDFQARAAQRLLASRLRAIGRKASATIDGVAETPGIVDGRRLFALTLTVKPEVGEPYEVTHAALVPEEHIGRVAQGGVLPVKVDPAEPRLLIIDWDQV